MTYQHVVLISIDTLRADAIASNPARLWADRHRLDYDLRTPFLDHLASQSAFFANTVTAAPYTSASHASILTGLWPVRHGLHEFFGRPLVADTVFSAAAANGYRTIMKADFPVMLGAHLGFGRDVDRYIVEDDDAFTDAIAACDRSCSLLHFGSVHIPYGFHNLRYGGRDYVAKIESLEEEFRHVPGADAADVLSETFRSSEDIELLLRYKRIIMALYANRRYDRLFELYLEGVEHASRARLEPAILRVMAALRGKRAIFVLFGDHGEEYGDDSYGHFNSVDEGVLRVPLLIWGDDIPPGRFTSRVRTIDIVPTLYDLLGWEERAATLDGRSLVGAIRGGARLEPRLAFSQAFVAQAEEADRAQRQFLGGRATDAVRHILYKEAVYGDDWKLSRRHYVVGSENRVPVPCPPEILLERFDDEGRPRPASDHAMTAKLLALLNAYGRRAADVGSTVDVPADLHRHLRNHGYLRDG